MSDELIRTTQGMAGLDAALERFMEASATARKRLSDTSWAELVAFMNAHPEVTIDDIMRIHEECLREFDAKHNQLAALQKRVKKGHGEVIDAILDARNRPGNR